ncbi:MAG: hypothetical protein HXY22_07115 [Alphaproteobacteria bacterium]|nr:hypothetical protein [Alphaproteobacteria bacterium]
MAKDWMGYEQMAQTALRGVVKMALERAAAQGLPGDHHFYITFDTRFPGVNIAEHLRARYPEEMTIVLQHRFWGLKVEDTRFTVSLSFNKVGEELVVPYAAVKAFFDPSVQFGLQFKNQASGIALRPGALQPAALQPPAKEAHATPAAPEVKPDANAAGGQVVSLDAFRKK